MRAVIVEEFGSPAQLVLREVDEPAPGAGEVKIRLEVSGVNYMDVYMRNGAYAKSSTYKTPLPMVLGMEGGGTVVELGEGVKGLHIGDRVAYCLSRGSYAEYAVVAAWRVVRIPDEVSTPTATAAMLQGLTAHYLTHSIFSLKKGAWCLIHAGAGGVGQMAIQMAKMIGARVITTVGNPEKEAIAKACGADHVILYQDLDFREEVMRITEGRGVDVVYDSVGKDTIERSIHSLRRRGMCVMFGASSGQVPCITPLSLAEAGSVYFTRPHLADYIADTDELNGRARSIFENIAAGKLRVPIFRTYPLEEAREAHITIESRGTRGKMLLQVCD